MTTILNHIWTRPSTRLGCFVVGHQLKACTQPMLAVFLQGEAHSPTIDPIAFFQNALPMPADDMVADMLAHTSINN